MNPRYDTITDKYIYGVRDGCKTSSDWINLILASMDQAGFSLKAQDSIKQQLLTLSSQERLSEAKQSNIKTSQLKTLIKAIIKESMDDDSDICPNCNGSGEGYSDGSKCSSCKGSGSNFRKVNKHNDPDYDWDKEREEKKLWGREELEEDDGVVGSHLINGQANNVAASRVNKVLASLSKGLFSDNSWEAINKIFDKLQELGLDVTITSAKYGGHADTQSGMPKFKEWQIVIPFTNKNGKQAQLVGQITAHGAGSVDQPLDRYDITAYVSPVMVKNN